MKILLASLLIFISFSSNAMTGNELYEKFNEYKKVNQNTIDIAFATGMYAGYVDGAVDTFQVLDILCPSSLVTRGQLIDTVGKFLENNPEVRHKAASSLVYNALKDIFSCKKE